MNSLVLLRVALVFTLYSPSWNQSKIITGKVTCLMCYIYDEDLRKSTTYPKGRYMCVIVGGSFDY